MASEKSWLKISTLLHAHSWPDSSFAYTHDVEVKNEVHGDWRKWFTQRRRWSIGQALWLKDWYKPLARRFIKKPQVFLPSLFFLYPSVVVFFLSAVIPGLWMYNSLLVFSLFLSVKFNIALPLFLLSLGTADVLKILLISMSGFAFTAAVFYGFSRKLGFRELSYMNSSFTTSSTHQFGW